MLWRLISASQKLAWSFFIVDKIRNIKVRLTVLIITMIQTVSGTFRSFINPVYWWQTDDLHIVSLRPSQGYSFRACNVARIFLHNRRLIRYPSQDLFGLPCSEMFCIHPSGSWFKKVHPVFHCRGQKIEVCSWTLAMRHILTSCISLLYAYPYFSDIAIYIISLICS